ncbi:MAG TPA: hypothetical protein VLG47_05325 [Candidatus Saccharimonadales bacterium]|nr:hypothetical protein [Candidatus Saccharimonadales bacterium]
MAGNFDPAVGLLNSRLEFGDIVAGRELQGSKYWGTFSRELDSVASDDPSGRFVFSGYGSAGLILPIHKYYADNQVRIRTKLASLGVNYAIYGENPGNELQVSLTEFDKHQAAINAWEQQHIEFNPRFLEPIFIGAGGPDSAIGCLTFSTLHKASAEALDDSPSMKMQVSSLYTRMAKIFHYIRGVRHHLSYGTVYFGAAIKSSTERYPHPQWGITPAAFFGMTLEKGSDRKYGFGVAGAQLASLILEQIVVS